MEKEFKKYDDSEDYSDTSDSCSSEDSQLNLDCYFCGVFITNDEQLKHFTSEKHIKKICKFINHNDTILSIKEFCESYLKTKEGMMEMHELFRYEFPLFNSIDYCFNSQFRLQTYIQIHKLIGNQIFCAVIAANIYKTNSRAAICGIIQSIFE